ncbi:MAG TPA: hypothetical protein VF316_13705 [Polyangiaceae bacterium]
MNRPRHPLLGVALSLGAAFATACAFWDMGGYSTGADAGSDAGVDAGVDAPPVDAAKDANGDAATCVPTFSVPYPGLEIREALDPSKEIAYVTSGHAAPDGGVSTGYLSVVDACSGKITKTFDPPLAGGKATWYLGAPAISGTAVYAASGSNPPLAGYMRFDTQTEVFTQAVLAKPSSYTDEIWTVTAPASGSVWISGTSSIDHAPSGIWTSKGDATGQPCGYFPPEAPENHGRAMIASGTDVYQAIADQSLKILHFDDAACAAKAPCGTCLPTWSTTSFVAPGGTGSQSAYALRLVGTKLYMSGFAVVTSTDFLGFVVELDLPSRTWGPVFTFNPSTAIDAVVSLAGSPDGTQLFAGAVKSWDGSPKFVSATGLLLTLPIPFGASPQATSINLPFVAPWSLDADARGVYIAGLTDTSDGLFIKCQSSTQCPTK